MMLTDSFQLVQAVIIFVVKLLAGLITRNPMFMIAMPFSFTITAIESMVHKLTVSLIFALFLCRCIPTFKRALHGFPLITTNIAITTFACVFETQIKMFET